MDIGDPDYERTIARIEALVDEVGPRRPTIAGRRAAALRRRAIVEAIASYAHERDQGRYRRSSAG